MTISSSMNAGVMGLSANATKLATISDNIANSNTYGYKRAVADFHSLVTSSNGGSYSAGGVRASTQRFIDEAGSLIGTSNSTDLAVRGGGFLPVTTKPEVNVDNGDLSMLLATTGSFRTDAEGYLKTENGLVLLGVPANPDGSIPAFSRDSLAGLEPIKINMSAISSEPTTEIELGVNLPATATEEAVIDPSTDYESLNVEYYNNLGSSQELTVEFRPSPAVAGVASNEWTIVITDSATIPATTVIGEYVMTFNDTQTSGGTLASVTTVTGGAYDPATGTVEVTTASGPIRVAIGELDTTDGITQFGASFRPSNITKNGSGVGTMTLVEVDENGFVYGRFDTGTTRTLYQVPLIAVANPNGLQAQDYETYQITKDSGAYYLWDAADGPTGGIVSYAREQSSTDVAKELTDLIQTQRAYSSNAKVIQTVDEMLQETTNIKR
ncbi:flagellar hook protein FlgE [Mangrovicoccus algicola]|uniref:Flagellar hook protein FlgE n=1 Tax=Mangrovicoccus algicola TaxID=2771008 RepID=A0A8J6YXZ5_9RHOB|nr:flagellar hook-basal body complex protein [Mangrovicoccus algicola]MBE3639715.1 flagellar hook-basal body complex protein [Mangrovicoccus algicola]